MAEQIKERSRNLGTGLRPTSFACWSPNWSDLLVVALSWVLVVAALRTATTVVTAERGLLYFLVYAIVGATCSVSVYPSSGWSSSGDARSRTSGLPLAAGS